MKDKVGIGIIIASIVLGFCVILTIGYFTYLNFKPVEQTQQESYPTDYAN